MKHVGIVVANRGSAIVTVERGADDDLLVTGMERLPFDLGAVADRTHALEDPETHFVIDGEGLGGALWAVLGRPDDEDHWRLYPGQGRDRQALVNELLLAIHEKRFHFAAGLAEQAAMNKALVGYRREVRDDGQIGGELVVALLLALIPPEPEYVSVYTAERGLLEIG
jgi:hypothetical protein